MYIKLDGELVWGPHKMNNGDSANLGQPYYERIFPEEDHVATIELWNNNIVESDDSLGTQSVNPGTMGQVPFTGKDADYTLDYTYSL